MAFSLSSASSSSIIQEAPDEDEVEDEQEFWR